MSLDVANISSLWKTDKLKYDALGKAIDIFIKDEITKFEILPEISYRTKELVSIIKKIRKKQGEKDYSYHSINDKLGIRIICSFQEDMQTIDGFLKKYFDIIKVEYKQDSLSFKTLDYISNHYDVKVLSGTSYFEHVSALNELVFEIQVRTLNQHCWANSSHALSYKQYVDLPDKLKRRLYRLLSIYEIADDEISSINVVLSDQPDNYTYIALRKLEGKFYRFAKTDFDRETSFIAITKLLSFFSSEEIKKIIIELPEFIENNSDKIERIYHESKDMFYEIPFLSQPEVFLAWYGIEKYQFHIEENWSNSFEEQELESLQNLWGKEIN